MQRRDFIASVGAGLALAPTAGWSQDAYPARFDSYDANRDRCLSQDEIAAGRAANAGGTNDGR